MSDRPDDARSSVWTIDLKTLAVIGPVFASALAVLYDVGFFTGINIDFFTFFTLSEHLLFALQAIPYAAFAAYSISGFFIGSWVGNRGTNKLIADLKAEPDFERRQAMAAPFLKRAESYSKQRPYIGGAMLFMACSTAVAGLYTSAFATLVAAAMVLWRNSWDELQKVENRKAIIFGIVAVVLLLAFLTGYERADTVLKTKTASENILIDDKITPARVIRSGERGVLFLSIDTKKLRFIRWDAIKQIDTL
jgi:hypothetical protein